MHHYKIETYQTFSFSFIQHARFHTVLAQYLQLQSYHNQHFSPIMNTDSLI